MRTTTLSIKGHGMRGWWHRGVGVPVCRLCAVALHSLPDASDSFTSCFSLHYHDYCCRGAPATFALSVRNVRAKCVARVVTLGCLRSTSPLPPFTSHQNFCVHLNRCALPRPFDRQLHIPLHLLPCSHFNLYHHTNYLSFPPPPPTSPASPASPLDLPSTRLM